VGGLTWTSTPAKLWATLLSFTGDTDARERERERERERKREEERERELVDAREREREREREPGVLKKEELVVLKEGVFPTSTNCVVACPVDSDVNRRSRSHSNFVMGKSLMSSSSRSTKWATCLTPISRS
jgi:hypothetical protein